MTPNPDPNVSWILNFQFMEKETETHQLGVAGGGQNQDMARPHKASNSSLALPLNYRSRIKLAWCPVKGGVLSAIGSGPWLETGPAGQAIATMGPCREAHPTL